MSSAYSYEDEWEYTVADKAIKTRPHYHLGENKYFTGNIDVVMFFMDDDESSWSDNTIEQYKNNVINPALQFLKTQAQSWNKSLDFVTVTHKVVYDGVVNPDLNDGGSTKDALDQAAKHIGYKSKEQMSKHLKPNSSIEIIYLVLLNKDGICYSRNQIESGTPYVEHAICFNNLYDYEQKEARAAVTASRILLLYGAESLFKPYGRLRTASQLYPYDVMLQDYQDLNAMEISDYTAFCIGWTDEIPEGCYIEEFWEE